MTATAHAGTPTERSTSHVDVVHVITTLTAGGAERQLALLTARSRYTSSVVALYDVGLVADSIRASGHRVEELHATGWRKPLAPFILARRLRRMSPDVVHVHLLSAQLLGIPAARLARVPLVVSTEHSLMADTIEGRPHTWWLRLLYRALERMASHTIAVSETTAERLQRWGVRRDRISVADLGIDLDAVAYEASARRAVRTELGIGPGTYVIGAVGRLAPVKRMHVVLRACAPLLREGSVLVVAGDGALLDELRTLADDLGVGAAVRWLGSREDVAAVLSALDVLVSASADETFGMAVVEGLGNGLPVVYVECPALDELDTRPEQATQVPSSGDDELDATRIGAAVAARSADSGDRRWDVPESLLSRFGAQAAADRVDDTYERLLSERHA